MLENNQIWEDSQYVLKIEKWDNDFHALIFKKENDSLRFINIIIQDSFDKTRIEKLIKKMNLSISNKFITLKDT